MLKNGTFQVKLLKKNMNLGIKVACNFNLSKFILIRRQTNFCFLMLTNFTLKTRLKSSAHHPTRDILLYRPLKKEASRTGPTHLAIRFIINNMTFFLFKSMQRFTIIIEAECLYRVTSYSL